MDIRPFFDTLTIWMTDFIRLKYIYQTIKSMSISPNNPVKPARRVLLFNPGKRGSHEVNRIHMGLTILASILKTRGHAVHIIDYAFLYGIQDNVYIPTVEESIRDFQPDVIGISAFTYLYNEAAQLIDQASACSQAAIIIGGPHALYFPEDFSSDHRISYIVRGEAETVISELIETMKPETTPVIINAPLPSAEQIPPLCLDAVYRAEYLTEYQLQLSRGCPYQCSFCIIKKVAGQKFRTRNLEACIAEIVTAVQKYPTVRTIAITDDCPTLNKKRFKYFLKLFKEANIKCNLTIDNVRADALDEEMVALYKEAGGQALCLGVESGNPTVFSLVNKGETLQEIEKATSLVRKYGLGLGLCFVIGLPEDNLERHQDSIRLAKRLKPNYIFWNMCIPWPGTDVYQWYKENGYIGNARNFSTLIDSHFNFDEPVASSLNFPRKQMIKAWLMANMETTPSLQHLKDLPKLFQLTIQYGMYRSFFIFLAYRFPLIFIKRHIPSSVKTVIEHKVPSLYVWIRNLLS